MTAGVVAKRFNSEVGAAVAVVPADDILLPPDGYILTSCQKPITNAL
jgi:hypothetical protein